MGEEGMNWYWAQPNSGLKSELGPKVYGLKPFELAAEAVESISLRRRREDCRSEDCRRERLSQGGLPAGSLTNDLAVVGASGEIVAVRSVGGEFDKRFGRRWCRRGNCRSEECQRVSPDGCGDVGKTRPAEDTKELETSEWTVPPLIRDSFSMIGSAVGGTAGAFYGFNHAMPVVRRWIIGPMWLHFLVGAPSVIIFSSGCAGLTGGSIPALAQLALLSYHAVMTSSKSSSPSVPSSS
ncbi:TSL-kinase interacting protein 1 [Striga asiatica]|uniref:TSL-kinase interacting protein 1 n=1 Tax=Striga asiatica TaxID=4170 RepID=A0A5A7Q3I3_STRAF|nr:TSL-kinase interacting protein 1 [Striga asiatica]